MEAEQLEELINRRRRQLTVHSFLYYQLNTNIISDNTFDAWSKELAQLQTDYPEIAAKCVYAEEFKKFDGSSGFDLPYHFPEVQNTGYKLLRIVKKKPRG
ncbi:DNA ligase LigA-related protein [Peribacillus muralis]|uniref:DNA ligase LigA-related protein n=1 Tax=Peribacillus muralis TaxID=264697 RepID=UPI00367332D1